MADPQKIIELLESSDPDECRLGLKLHAQLECKGGLLMTMAENRANATIEFAEMSLADRMKPLQHFLNKTMYGIEDKFHTIITGKKGLQNIRDLLKKEIDNETRNTEDNRAD